MPKNRPRCHCGGDMKRNGTTSKGTTRWRCKACGASSIKRRPDVTNARIFADFIEHCTTTISLTALAKRNNVSHSTMKRRFTWCWLIDVPDPTVAHKGRVYDQIFLDGTYTAGGCLIVASTLDHVVAWHWCKHETEVPRVLFLGICLDRYYFLWRGLLPKIGFHLNRGSVSQALVEPCLVPP